MTAARLVNSILIEGAIGGAAIAVSRFFRESAGRSWLVILLFTATGAYVGFVVVADEGLLWILIELAHIVAFGVTALRGLRGSPHWLAAAWGFHQSGVNELREPKLRFVPANFTMKRYAV